MFDTQAPPRVSQNTTARTTVERPSTCPVQRCDGSGYYALAVKFGHPEFGKLQRCACLDQLEAERLIERRAGVLATLASELGGELAGCTLDNYDLGRAADATALGTMTQALDMCRGYVADPVGWLFFHGPTGVGKSHLTAAVARALAESKGFTVAYASEPALMAFLREGFRKRQQETDDSDTPFISTDERVALLQTVGILVLDDVGTEPRGRTGWVDSQLFAILNVRYQHDRPTVITSNLTLDDLEARIRSRIKGRTNEDYCGRVQRVEIDNVDQREGVTK